jgi:hypothetical protein
VLIADKLSNEKPENKELLDLKNHFAKSIESFKENQQKFKSMNSYPRTKIIEHFHRKFSHLYINHIVN